MGKQSYIVEQHPEPFLDNNYSESSDSGASKQLILKGEHCITSNRNVTRHRNGQSVKSRQTRWEWQLLISIMHIHDVVTCYNNRPFLCAWHVNIMAFFALPPCCVDESLSYSHVCVSKMYWWMIM